MQLWATSRTPNLCALKESRTCFHQAFVTPQRTTWAKQPPTNHQVTKKPMQTQRAPLEPNSLSPIYVGFSQIEEDATYEVVDEIRGTPILKMRQKLESSATPMTKETQTPILKIRRKLEGSTTINEKKTPEVLKTKHKLMSSDPPAKRVQIHERVEVHNEYPSVVAAILEQSNTFHNCTFVIKQKKERV